MSDGDPLATEGRGLSANPDDSKGYRRPATRPRPSGERRPIGNTLILAALAIGLATAGWFIASQHQALTVARDELMRSEKRIALLEERLQVTDQTMSEADKEVTTQLGAWQDEVRKLWDVTNRRNKTWIEENRAKIKEQGETLKGVDTTLKELKASVARHDSTLTQLAAIAEQLTDVESQLTRLTTQQRQLTDQLNATRQTVAGLESGLARRVADAEKAVQTFDSYRLQLNSRIIDLQTRVDRLSAAETP
jgi:predicted  nucleic acid-binding Zn-ribbon protein